MQIKHFIFGLILLFWAISLRSESRLDRWQSRLSISMNKQKPAPKRITDSILEEKWHDSLIYVPNYAEHWVPRDFFADPGAIALIDAIVDRDVGEMERLISSGVNVNKKGVGGMNALYWSWYIDDDPRPFECLLRHGADPNILVCEGAGGKATLLPGRNAVVHLVSRMHYNRLFKLVFENGGDPNLLFETFNPRTPFSMLGTEVVDEKERFELLVRCGANIDQRYYHGESMLFWLFTNPSLVNMRRAIRLLDLGADAQLDYFEAIGRWKAEWRGCHFRLIHVAAVIEEELPKTNHELKRQFQAAVDRLEGVGESMDGAKEDLKRWKSWIDSDANSRIEDEWFSRAIAEIESADSQQDKKRWSEQLFRFVTRPSAQRLALAKKLLDSGVDFRCDYSKSMALWRSKWSRFDIRLIHILEILAKESEKYPVGANKEEFMKLIDILDSKGDSIVAARSELADWERELSVLKRANSETK